jgi:hypothetical protein
MRNRYVLLADLGAIALCMLGAFVLRLDWFFTRSPDETAAFLYALGTGTAGQARRLPRVRPVPPLLALRRDC